MFEHMSLLLRSPCSFKRQKMVLFWCVCMCGVFVCVCVLLLKKGTSTGKRQPFSNSEIWVSGNKWNEHEVMSETLRSRINCSWFCVPVEGHHKFYILPSFLTPTVHRVDAIHPHEVYMGWWALWWTRIGGWSISSLQLRESRDWHKIAHQKGLWVPVVELRAKIGTWGPRSPGEGMKSLYRQQRYCFPTSWLEIIWILLLKFWLNKWLMISTREMRIVIHKK